MLITLTPLKHDGVFYDRDTEVPEGALNADQTKELTEAGVIKEIKSMSSYKREKLMAEESPKAQDEVANPEVPAVPTPAETPADAVDNAVNGEVSDKKEVGTPNGNWKKAKLLAYATENKVEGIDESMTRGEILAKINAVNAPVEAEETETPEATPAE